MSVEFNEPEYGQAYRPIQKKYGGVTNVLLKLGLAKTPGQANVVMLIISVLSIGLTIYFLMPAKSPNITPTATMNGAPFEGQLP